jgi:hypothetical protein
LLPQSFSADREFVLVGDHLSQLRRKLTRRDAAEKAGFNLYGSRRAAASRS